MSHPDQSRFLFEPAKHYSSVRMQQGRVLVDSDFNEHAEIAAEELRATMLDIMCTRGTPNEGMALTSPELESVTLPNDSEHDTFNFTLAAGSYYLGGMRLAMESSETFLRQSDWLQVDADAANMPAVTAGMEDRFDLVYMLAWEQPVSAVEDRELLEPALGGRDTSVRIKRMRRFEVLSDVSAGDCQTAFGELIESLTRGDYDSSSGELVSKARLSVSFDADPVEQDICADPTTSGYVEAENQAIRVELREDKLVWGYDNASRLYRVQVLDTNEKSRLTFLTEPGDVTHFPLADQVVEILPWGALLPNGEKVAESQGMLARVSTTYDPSTKELVIDTDVPADWIEWLADHDVYDNEDDPSEERKFFYLRVWERGGASDSTEISYSSDSLVSLGNTGLSVTISADGMPGDYWIIAARPSTPEVVTPWNLGGETAVPPHGPRRFYTPIATIDWTGGADPAGEASDCRAKLTPLCAVGGCCTVTVGDGKRSFGQVSTLQDAIDVVPDGGKICLLPGVHEGNALIDGRSDIVIEGCGDQSVLENPKPSSGSTDFTTFLDPVLHIRDSDNIVIRNLAIEGFSAVGVIVEQDAGVCTDIRLEQLWIHSTGGFTIDTAGQLSTYDLPAPGICLIDAREVDIIGCKVSSVDLLNFSFGVVLSGEHLRMHDCEVTASAGQLGVSSSLWGVNVRSTSRDVEIVGCTIDGGWGHGIALGHGDFFADDADDITVKAVRVQAPTAGMSYTTETEPDDCDCGPQRRPLPPTHTAPEGEIFLPAGPVEDLRIYDNQIRNHGFSGISTTLFFPHGYDYQGAGAEAARFIVVTDADIARNVIEDNLLIALPSEGFVNYDVAVGGIVLAASVNAWIRDNTIRSNGQSQTEMPMCGVGLVAAMNAVIEGNMITDTGQVGTGRQVYRYGLRGGIAVGEATGVRIRDKEGTSGEAMPAFLTGTGGANPPEPIKDWTNASKGSAVVVRGNEVVHPLGRALWVRRAFGAVTVTGNSLTSYGSPIPGDGPTNTDMSWKLYVAGALTSTGALRRPAAGAVVEVNDFCLPAGSDFGDITLPTVEMVDPGATALEGGAVLMSANKTHLEWTQPGGWSCAVLLSSFDSAAMTGNSCTADMGATWSIGPNLDVDEPLEFLKAMAWSTEGNSFLICHAYVGGLSGALMSGNQISEGTYEALFSGGVGAAMGGLDDLLVGSSNADCMVGNIGSHCFASQTEENKAANVALNSPATTGFGPDDYSVESTAGDAGTGQLVEIYVSVS